MLFQREGDIMATIQIDIPEEDRERFVRQAQREGKTLDAWLISVGRQHSPRPEPPSDDRFQSGRRAYGISRGMQSQLWAGT